MEYDDTEGGKSEQHCKALTAGSERSWNNQQHIRASIPKVHKQPEAQEYVTEATKHLVEMGEAYGDEIDEADKDDLAGRILGVVGGKEPPSPPHLGRL